MFKSLLIVIAIFAVQPAVAEDVAADEVSAEVSSDAALMQDADVRIDIRIPGPGRPGPGNGGWGHPRHRPMMVCMAQNLRGQTFVGRGFDMRDAARDAIDNCYQSRSRRCEVIYGSCRYGR